MKKAICIHGHFYQPPRENPWLEYVEIQSSAYPYHDWNERITNECYLPNSAARIVNDQNKIIDIVNNYSKISFNFGPTLLLWMKNFHPEAYQCIIESEEKSVRENNPAAIAQCYNHMIMPLSNLQDKITQVIWGIKDFEYHFKQKPLGMWLPETAVDIETLEVLAKEKIKFTILAEHQVKEIKKINGDKFEAPFKDFSLNSPFLLRLPSGKSILIYIFNGNISYKISFSDLLSNGIAFANSLMGEFKDQENFQLVSIATDGETFGHHKKFGDMALAACLRFLKKENFLVCSYSRYLEESKILYEITINENTSWSCAHGIGRWKEDCSCNVGSFPHGNQKWRKFLRESMDFIRDNLTPKYQEFMKSYNKDPWELRNDYITIILNRSKKNIEAFLQKHFNKNLSSEEKTLILTYLEIQRHLMLMYTSCGWFFDDISGIETVQILRYAKRALQLAKDQELENRFLGLLEKAQSNDPTFQNGKVVYEKFVNPSMLSLENVSSHYAITMLFEDIEKNGHFLCYAFETKNFKKETIGFNILLKGSLTITSLITYETKELLFISLFLDPFTVFSYIEAPDKEKEYLTFFETAKNLFSSKKFTELNQLFLENKQHKNICSFWDMFTDEKNKIFQKLLKSLFKNYNDLMKEQLENKMQMFCEIKAQNIILPDLINRSLDLYFYFEIYNLINEENLDLKKCEELIIRTKQWNINFQTPHIKLETEKKLQELFHAWQKSPLNIHSMEKIVNFLTIFVKQLNIKANLWHFQNSFFMIKKEHKETLDKIDTQSDSSQKWKDLFLQIADLLNFSLN